MPVHGRDGRREEGGRWRGGEDEDRGGGREGDRTEDGRTIRRKVGRMTGEGRLNAPTGVKS